MASPQKGGPSPVQIVTWENSRFRLDANKLAQVLHSVDIRDNFPVALVGILGPHQSGKTFLCHLIHNYFHSDSRSHGWVSKVRNCVRGAKANKTLGTSYFPGVVLWPVPLRVEHGVEDNVNDMLVWVLEVKFDKDGDEVDQYLGILMTLICSRLAEVTWDEESFRYLNSARILTNEWKLSNPICKDVIYVLRKDKLKLHGTDSRSFKKSVKKFMSSSNPPSTDFIGFRKVRPDNWRSTVGNVQNVIQAVTDEDHLTPKTTGGGTSLSVNTFMNFMQDCCNLVNGKISVATSTHTPKATPVHRSRSTTPTRHVDDNNHKALLQYIEDHFMPQIDSRVYAWIDLLQDPKYIPNGKLIYSETFEAVFQVLQNSHLNGTSLRQTLYETTHHYEQTLERITATVDQYFRNMKAYCDHYKELTQAQLMAAHNDAMFNILTTTGGSQYVQNSVVEACKKLVTSFKVAQPPPPWVPHKDQELVQVASDKVVQFYSTEMSRFSQRKLDPGLTPVFNTALKEACLQKFSTALDLHRQPSEATVELMKSKLRSMYIPYQDENLSRLKSTMEAVKKIILRQREEYVKDLNQALQQYPSGLEESRFADIHTRSRARVVSSTAAQIREKIGKEEPTQVHIVTLEAHIDRLWKAYQEENGANLKKVKQIGRTAQKQAAANATKIPQPSKPKSPTPPLQRTASTSSIQKSPVPKSRTSQLQRTVSTSSVQRSASKSPTSPLHRTASTSSFHVSPMRSDSFMANLCLSIKLTHGGIRIGIWLDGKSRILRNEFGEDFTPAVVGLTRNRKFVYGLQAVMQETGILQKKWTIGDHFENLKHLLYDVPVKGGNRTVGIEFLLGFLLKKLKVAAEKEIRYHIKSCLITVPLYFVSSHRRQVVHAARAAGFSYVQVANDISAAAFEFAFHSNKLEPNSKFMLIIGENMGHIYGALYERTGAKKISMHAHHQDYIKTEPKSGMKVLGKLIGGKSSLPPQQAQVASVLNQLLSGFKKEKSLDIRQIDKHVLVSCESGHWEGIIMKMVDSYNFTPVKGDLHSLHGAIHLSPNLSKIGESLQEITVHPIYRNVGKNYALLLDKNQGIRPGAVLSAPLLANESLFSQFAFGEIFSPVGTLHLPSRSRKGQEETHEAKFLLNYEGSVELQAVELKDGKKMKKMLKQGVDYVWETPNHISLEEVPEYAAMIESHFSTSGGKAERAKEPVTKTLSKTSQGKSGGDGREELIQICEEMIRRLNARSLVVSDIVRPSLVKACQDALRVAMDPSKSSKEVQRQRDTVQMYYDKYAK